MSRPTLDTFSHKHQAQIVAQLHATPRPKTVALAEMQPVAAPKAAKKKRKRDCAVADGFLVACGLPSPTPEHRFHPSRKWRFDYCWPEAKVALEVEGGVWTGGRHTRGSGFVKDMEKYNAAALLGWRVVRCVPSKLRTAETAAMLRELLKVAA